MTAKATTTVSVPAEVKEGLTFTRKSDKSKLPEKLERLTAAITKLNTVVNGDDVGAIREAQDEATAALEEYNNLKTRSDYDDIVEGAIARGENPMKPALVQGYITLKKVTSENTLGVVTYSVEDYEAQIDFIAFNSLGGRLMGAKTQPLASQLGYMVLVAKGVKDGNSAAQITAAYQKSKGKVITKVFSKAPSNNELKAALQELIDSIYFEDNGKGQNRFMVTTEWLHWFADNINSTRYGKGSLSRSAKSVKAIIQSAAALYHAFFNRYGVSTVVDKENAVLGKAVEPDGKKTAAA